VVPEFLGEIDEIPQVAGEPVKPIDDDPIHTV
jgi:hypothetical protein